MNHVKYGRFIKCFFFRWVTYICQNTFRFNHFVLTLLITILCIFFKHIHCSTLKIPTNPKKKKLPKKLTATIRVSLGKDQSPKSFIWQLKNCTPYERKNLDDQNFTTLYVRWLVGTLQPSILVHGISQISFFGFPETLYLNVPKCSTHNLK